MYLVINKWVTAVKVSNFSGHYLRNRSTLDIGVLGYIGIVWPKEHSPEIWHIPPVTPCIWQRQWTVFLEENCSDLKMTTSSSVVVENVWNFISVTHETLHQTSNLTRDTGPIFRTLVADWVPSGKLHGRAFNVSWSLPSKFFQVLQANLALLSTLNTKINQLHTHNLLSIWLVSDVFVWVKIKIRGKIVKIDGMTSNTLLRLFY